MKSKLYTIDDCVICKRVKGLIIAQNLQIEIINANEFQIEVLREKGLRSFPVLKIDEEKYLSGKEAGEYLATNLERLKKK
jgi:glutaredoxin